MSKTLIDPATGAQTKVKKGEDIAEAYKRLEEESLRRSTGSKLGITSQMIRDDLGELLDGAPKVLLAAFANALAAKYEVDKEKKNQVRIRIVSALKTNNSAFEMFKEEERTWLRRIVPVQKKRTPVTPVAELPQVKI